MATLKTSKPKVSKIMIVLICIMIILYTAADFALQYFSQVEVSPTLTTAWFTFWGVELVNLAIIKTSKIKYGADGVASESTDKKSTSNILLFIICAMIILYTAANFVLQYFTLIEVSSTLTTAWFAFWGAELIALTAIKTSKVKHNKDTNIQQ